MIAYLNGDAGQDVVVVDRALADRSLVLAPVSLTELLSDPKMSAPVEKALLDILTLEILPGYWERTGRLRALLLRHNHRPKIADSLIAQSCLDHHVLLVTRDVDFVAFKKLADLKLLLAASPVQ